MLYEQRDINTINQQIFIALASENDSTQVWLVSPNGVILFSHSEFPLTEDRQKELDEPWYEKENCSCCGNKTDTHIRLTGVPEVLFPSKLQKELTIPFDIDKQTAYFICPDCQEKINTTVHNMLQENRPSIVADQI